MVLGRAKAKAKTKTEKNFPKIIRRGKEKTRQSRGRRWVGGEGKRGRRKGKGAGKHEGGRRRKKRGLKRRKEKGGIRRDIHHSS